MKIITLTTDFGLDDGYVASMKGVILGIAPEVRLVDITHAIPPQHVQNAAYVLQSAAPYFPHGTIHLAVVDPGVGSARRAIAIRTERAYFVGPDNGLFSFAMEPAQAAREVIHLDEPAFWLPSVSQTFHGRDIFAPVAAHLAAGVAFEALGSPITNPVILPATPPARLVDGRILGQIVHVDHFGNLISNVPAEWLAGRQWTLAIAGQRIVGLSPSYAAAAHGQLLALIGSSGALEIAVRDGSAAQQLGVGAGAPIEAQSKDR